MGDALLVRKGGGGSKVFIDGVRYKDDLNLYSQDCETELSKCPYSDYGGTAVLLNGEIHVLGGYSHSTNHYKWNGSAWTKVSTLPSSFQYSYKCAVVLNNEIHILVVSDNYGYKNNHYKWNGSAWTKVSTLPYEFRYGRAVVLNNEIHILGTNSSSNSSSNSYKHYKWNGSSWVSVSTLPYSFITGCAVVLNNEIHILGGNSSDYVNKHYKWNGSSWVSVSTLPYSLCKGQCEVVKNEIHIFGTSYTDYGNNHYKWNGSAWTKCDNMSTQAYDNASVEKNGKIHLLFVRAVGSSVAAGERHIIINDTLYKEV